MTGQLFDPATTTDRVCPVETCGAKLASQHDKSGDCDYDHCREDYRKRPAGCLNAHDPRYADLPF